MLAKCFGLYRERMSTGTLPVKERFRDLEDDHQALLTGDTCLGNSVFEVHPVCNMFMMMLLNN